MRILQQLKRILPPDRGELAIMPGAIRAHAGWSGMMTKTNMLYARAGATAIAAALALSSTTGFAQQVQTVPSNPAPTTNTTTPTTTPTTEQAPATDTTTTTTTTTADPAAPATTVERTTTVKRTTAPSAAATAAAAARRAQAQNLARTLAARSAARTAPAAPAAPAVAAMPVAPAAPAPAVANPAASQAVAAKPASNGVDERTLELGGGALALLALGGGAYALMRRRRHDEEEWVDEPAVHDEQAEYVEPVAAEPVAAEPVAVDAVPAGTITAMPRHDPVEQAGFLAPSASAFGWNGPSHDTPVAHSTDDEDDDRLPGESWVERAERGPSANNPSLSLKKRLKRAAFFDQREREVAEGSAVPVDPDAGLPENLDESENEHA